MPQYPEPHQPRWVDFSIAQQVIEEEYLKILEDNPGRYFFLKVNPDWLKGWSRHLFSKERFIPHLNPEEKVSDTFFPIKSMCTNVGFLSIREDKSLKECFKFEEEFL
jgi:hypothetical protein